MDTKGWCEEEDVAAWSLGTIKSGVPFSLDRCVPSDDTTRESTRAITNHPPSPPPNPPVVDPGPERDLDGRIHCLHRHRHHVGRRVPRPQQAVTALVRGKLPHGERRGGRAPIGGRQRRRGGGEAPPQRWLAQAPRASSERREHPTCCGLWGLEAGVKKKQASRPRLSPLHSLSSPREEKPIS